MVDAINPKNHTNISEGKTTFYYIKVGGQVGMQVGAWVNMWVGGLVQRFCQKLNVQLKKFNFTKN